MNKPKGISSIFGTGDVVEEGWKKIKTKASATNIVAQLTYVILRTHTTWEALRIIRDEWEPIERGEEPETKSYRDVKRMMR